jgi:hypothetical protein
LQEAVPKIDPDGKEEQPLEVSGPSKGIPEDGWVVSAMLEKRMGNKSSQILGAKAVDWAILKVIATVIDQEERMFIRVWNRGTSYEAQKCHNKSEMQTYERR